MKREAPSHRWGRWPMVAATTLLLLGAALFLLTPSGDEERASADPEQASPQIADIPVLDGLEGRLESSAPSRRAGVSTEDQDPKTESRDVASVAAPEQLQDGPADGADALPWTGPQPVVEVRRGERVEILDRPGGRTVARARDETEFGSPSVFWVQRRTAGWVGVATPELPNGELGWIRADARRLILDSVDEAITVDLSERSARLFEGGRRSGSWRITIGAAESPTPTGRFAVTDTFRGGLNPVYGCCAVALTATQPNLPASWPGGDRIAFHGTEGPLGEAISNGCLRSRDEQVDALVDRVPPGTPVLVSR